MTDYLFHRKGGCPAPETPVELLSGDVFFHLWSTRQHPFNQIRNGDRLWWVDQVSREVRWELRVVELLKQQFNTPSEALSLLRRAYGLLPDDLDEYFSSASTNGWLLAFAVEVMQPVRGVRLPAGERLGRNGLRSLRAELLDELSRSGLPAPAVTALTSPPRTANASAISAIFVPEESRHVPSWMKAEIWERDGGICQECGSRPSRADVHFDHTVPFSRGGRTSMENLRVLCSTCNLRKGARMPPRASIRVFDEPVADLAATLGRSQPRSVDDLVALVSEAVSSRELDAAEAAVVGLSRDVEFDEVELDRCIDALAGASELADRVRLLRLHDVDEDQAIPLLQELSSKAGAVGLEARLELVAAGALEPAAVGPTLLEAVGSDDQYIVGWAVMAGAGLPEAEQRALGLPALDTLHDSPVVEWGTGAALAVATLMIDEADEGELDGVEVLRLGEIALTSSNSTTATEAALLLAELFADVAEPTEATREAARRYLGFAAAGPLSGDDWAEAGIQRVEAMLADA